MARPTSKTTLTGVASCVMLLPSVASLGCRRPSADLALPEHEGAGQRDDPACKPCAAAPRAAAGSADDHDAPVIVGARFVARDRVQLTFSEPIAPVELVNPRQFRLSHAYSMVDGGADPSDPYDQGYATGYYYDVAGSDSYEQPLVVVKLERYADQPEVLALTLNKPITVDFCQQIIDSRTNLDQPVAAGSRHHGETGLFLHYTSRGSDGVRDRVNNPLADIGADWALNFGSRHKTVYGAEPVMRLDLLTPLACPDASMTALTGPPGPV